MSSTDTITETRAESIRRDDSISLRSIPSSNGHRLSTESRRQPNPRQTSYSQRLLRGIGSESKRQPQVLIANAVLQVPIWGFPMTYGIFQDYLLKNAALKGSHNSLGVIGTTSNGVMYLSMPILFSLFSRRFIHLRRHAAIAGVIIQCVSFLLSAFATQVWQLVVTQGVLAAMGATLVYSPTTLSLSENFTTNSRAVAYGVVLSAKNITGTACPFLIQYLLDHHGFRYTMIVWTAIVGGMGLICSLIMPMHAFAVDGPTAYRSRKIPWDVLRHQTIWITAVATMLQSSGYGLPQTYLSSYASSIASLSVTSSTLLITLFNAPGIISSSFFGFLSDNKRFPLSATAVAFISAFGSAMAAFFLWGFSSTSSHSLALLILFSVTYGFFAGAYSATWGGSIKDMEREAAERNEALDTGIVYGLLNGARGIGYVGGGLAGVQLLKAGQGQSLGKFAYGTEYGPVILYTGLATLMGGWGIFFQWRKLLR